MMKKRSLRRILPCLLLLVFSFTMAAPVFAVESSGGVRNGSFEEGTEKTPLNGWTATGNASVVSEKTPYGSRVLKISGEKDYAAEVSQTVTGLKNGYYYLTAYARSTGGQPLSVLYGQGAGQSRCMTALPATEGILLPIKGQWVQVVVRGIHVTDGTITVGYAANAEAGQYALLDNIALAMEPDQSAQFQLEKGGDTSMVSYVEGCGGKYYESDGKTESDPYQLLADNGWDIARIRLYNDPGKGRGDGSYYCLEEYQNLDDVLASARRAKEKGLKIEFTFHYSDYWSNGGTQIIPADWQKKIAGKSDAEAVKILEQCVYEYTRDVMRRLKEQGTAPEYVSLGNEMQGGLLYPLGRASTECWPNLARFINAGYRAVKEICPDAQVILHLDDASNVEKYTAFFDNCEKFKAKYDIIGCSYYPFWTKTSVQSVVDFANALIERYHRDIMVMETGFGFDDHLAAPHRGQTGQLSHNIPYSDPTHSEYDGTIYEKNPHISKHDGKMPSATIEMQREFMIELFNGLKAIGLGTKNRCLGDLYWDPILIEQEGVGWGMFESTDLPDINAVSNTTLFGFEHQLLPVMDAYRSNREGDGTGAVSGKLQTSGGQGIINAAFTIHLDKDYTVTTDAYGSFRISGIPAGSYSAAVTAEGLTVESKTVSVTVTAGTTSQLTLTASAASLNGTVTDDGNKAVSGAKVTAVSGKTVHRTLTNSDGTYSFPAIPAGTYTVTAEKTGYTPGQKSAAAVMGKPQTANPQMVLVSGAASGKVTDRYGWPLAGAVVNAGPGLSVKTDEQGLYTLEGLLAGQSYTLTFSNSGYVSEKKPVSVGKGKTAAVSAELFKDSGIMTGLVTDVEGKPVEGATISLTQNWVLRSETTGADGRFTMDWLTKGEVNVQVTAENRVSQGFKCTIVPEGTVDAGIIVLPERLEVKNPSFDADAAETGWTITCTPKDAIDYAWRPENSQYDGPYALTLWSASAYKGDVEQAVQLTDAGNYVFRIQGYAGLTYGEFGNSELYIYVKDSSGKELGRTAVPNSDGYVGYEVSFRASEAGAYTLGIHVDAKGGDWAVFDMAELGKVCHPAQRDVDVNAWYHEAVDYVLDNGLMSGYGNSQFGTYRLLSRAHLAQILYNVEGKPEVGTSGNFTDVPETMWCYDAVTWAESQGILSGYGDGRFGPGNPITREQFAVLLRNYAQSKGQDVSASGAKASGFPDFSETGAYAVPGMEWAVDNGVINGKDGHLEPKGRVSRAQAAQMLKDFFSKFKK